MCMFSLMFMVIATAFVFFNSVAIKPLDLLHIINKMTDWKKKKKAFCYIVRNLF